MIFEKRTNTPSRRRPALAAALGLMLLAAPLPGHSQIYRWVDADGITHFSQTPPPSGQYRHMQAPPPPAEDPRKAQAKIDSINRHIQDQLDAEHKQAQQDRHQQRAQAQRATICRQAKKRLTALTIRPHILVTSHDGQTRRMTEPQRQADIKATKGRIAEYCSQ